MTAPKKLPKVVAIVWLDAVAGAGWTDHDEAPEAATIYTVGFLVKKTRKEVTIATSVGDTEHNGSMTIPRGMIQSMVELS
ncbi:MAG: hypothetical protein LC121_23560 [Anaerolineae bacterium]|nr:hypothetical protein [Anaerolineae bacterium]